MDFYQSDATLDDRGSDLGRLTLAEPAELFAGPRQPGQSEIEAAIRTLIAATGDDPSREGLLDTPTRVARAYREWFAGYAIDPASLLERTFGEAEGYDETVLLRSIPLVSTCEHALRSDAAPRRCGRYRGVSQLYGESRSEAAWRVDGDQMLARRFPRRSCSAA